MAGRVDDGVSGMWFDHALTDIVALLRDVQVWRLFGAAVILFAIAGPFGSYFVLNFPMRLAMWSVVGGGMFITGVVAYFMVAELLPGRLVGGPFAGLVAGVLATVPVVIVALIVDLLFVDVPITFARAVTDWLNLTPFVLALIWLISKTRVTENARALRVLAGAPVVPFLDRVKRDIGRDLVSLTSQDHYIEVVTGQGRDLVLGRFSDVVAQLADWDGAQIHRSHWMARRAVAGVERQGARAVVRLSDGRILPVSRTYAEAVKRLY
ncbi:MAG: LytTR family DNA-binding domain-containing protein [Deltaproteobacteria bacterium]